jgi:hypothetical protein
MTEKLSPKQIHALALLLQGESIENTAKAVGVSSQSIDNWLKKDDFKEQFNKGKDQVYSAVVNKLTTLATKALDSLESVLDSREASHDTKVRAAKVVVDNIPRYRSIDLADRLEKLEEQIGSLAND